MILLHYWPVRGEHIMPDRESALRNLAVGDIFHGRSPNGASLVCLVTAVDNETIDARRIHTQDDLRFDRRTGIELGEVKSRIDCVAPLPLDIYNVLVAMDRKGQALAAMFRSGVEPDPEQYKLTDAEKKAGRLLTAHIEAPLPRWAMMTFRRAISGAILLSSRVMYSYDDPWKP